MIASLTLMKRPDLDRLQRDLTCFLIPMGGIEGHGDHLPMGTKVLFAEDWAYALAKKLQATLPTWNFIIMPMIPLTVDSVTSEFTLNVRPHVVRDAVVDQCEQLKRKGFTNFAVLSAQPSPRQLVALEDASRIVSRGRWFFGKRAHLMSVTSALVTSNESWASPMISIPVEHAGALETGLVLKINSEWVSGQYKTLPGIERPRPTTQRFIEFFKGKIGGYWGNPAGATPAQYEQSLEIKNNTLAESIKIVLESGRGLGAFRSSYRFFPLNGSFFKAYLLATFFFILMLFWVIWTLKGNFDVDT